VTGGPDGRGPASVALNWGEVSVPLTPDDRGEGTAVVRVLGQLPRLLLTPWSELNPDEFLEWRERFYHFDSQWTSPFLRHLNAAALMGQDPQPALLTADAVSSLYCADLVGALWAAAERRPFEVPNSGNCRKEFKDLCCETCLAAGRPSVQMAYKRWIKEGFPSVAT